MWLLEFAKILKKKMTLGLLQFDGINIRKRKIPFHHRKGIFVEMDREHHLLLKQIAQINNINLKDVVWLTVEFGYDSMINYLHKLRNEIINN